MAEQDRNGAEGERAQIAQRPQAPPQAQASAMEAETGHGPGLGERARLGIRANLRWGAVILTLGAALGAWWLSLEEKLAVAPSRIGAGSTVTANPLEGTSQAYDEALAEGEAARKAEAQEQGESFVEVMGGAQDRLGEPGAEPVQPRVVPPSAQASAASETPAEEDDPLVKRQYTQPESPGTALLHSEAAVQTVAIDAMLEELIAAWSAAPQMTLIRYAREGQQEAAPTGESGGAEAIEPGGGSGAPGGGEVLVPAGRMVYAAAKVGVDSELPLPVLVEVLERPLVGALLRGEFQQVRDRMLVRFTRLSDERRGLELAVNAYAVGLECECAAVDGEIDRHWFSRVILPAAFGFAQEYLAAAAQPQVTVSVDGQVISQRHESAGRERVARGVAGALGQGGEVVFESLPRRSTLRLPRGTEFAVVFVDAVEAGAG